MTEFAELIAQPGERHVVYGGTRAGKSSFIDWQIREIQRTRPDCMQILIDSKPRFRAELERGAFGPKADALPLGGMSIGAKARRSPIPVSLTFMPIILFADSGRDRAKWQSCNPAMPTIGDGCSFFYLRLSKRKSETGNDTCTLTKCLISTAETRTQS